MDRVKAMVPRPGPCLEMSTVKGGKWHLCDPEPIPHQQRGVGECVPAGADLKTGERRRAVEKRGGGREKNVGAQPVVTDWCAYGQYLQKMLGQLVLPCRLKNVHAVA
jgi:hypothetical protein